MAGRKPVHLMSSAGKVSGRQAMWQVMRKRKRFTARQVADDINADRDAVKSYLKCLVNGGIVAEDGKEPAPTGVFRVKPTHRNLVSLYRLAIDCGVDAPRLRKDGSPCVQGLPREQMWRTMHMIPSFTTRDLAASASTEAVPVDEDDAKNYIGHLYRAGYLDLVKSAKPGHKPGTGNLAVYRLVKKTGPRPPMIQRLKTVFDPNLGQIVWHDEVDA